MCLSYYEALWCDIRAKIKTKQKAQYLLEPHMSPHAFKKESAAHAEVHRTRQNCSHIYVSHLFPPLSAYYLYVYTQIICHIACANMSQCEASWSQRVGGRTAFNIAALWSTNFTEKCILFHQEGRRSLFTFKLKNLMYQLFSTNARTCSPVHLPIKPGLYWVFTWWERGQKRGRRLSGQQVPKQSVLLVPWQTHGWGMGTLCDITEAPCFSTRTGGTSWCVNTSSLSSEELTDRIDICIGASEWTVDIIWDHWKSYTGKFTCLCLLNTPGGSTL